MEERIRKEEEEEEVEEEDPALAQVMVAGLVMGRDTEEGKK